MNKAKMGNTHLRVSRLCIGTDYARVYGGSSLGLEILLEGFDDGVNFWDTSEAYGSYPALREALKKLDRGEIVITSKSFARTRQETKRHLEEALQEIGTDYIDIFLLHGIDTQEEFNKDALDYLIEAKRSGFVKAVGASTHSAKFAFALSEIPEIEVALVVLNMQGVEIKHGDLGMMHKAVKRLYEAGKGVYLMKVLGRGKLADRAEEALRYVFQIPYVHAVSVGIQTLEELKTAVKVANES